MPLKGEMFKAARKASGITIEQAASITGLKATSTYCSREDDPGMYRLHELEALYESMSDTARPILREAVGGIFLLS